ncbi:MAG: hypothetical protein ABSG74_04640 [Candidatus Bathyarchaeia archaeon]|jgi:hypothetical protein
MLSPTIRRCLVLGLAVLIISQAFSASSAQIIEDQWREASPTRVIIRSTADWGRLLFDDLNGTNSNGLRIRSVIDSGWLEGKDSNDQLYVGRKIAWPDTEFDAIIARKGDMVAFFKGLNNFNYTEVYADLILEVNTDLPRVYIWLMTGGNGTTSFEIVNQDNGGTLWRDIIVATGETQQVKRVMSPQPFFQPGRAESSIVVTWLTLGIIVMVLLNFPILETILTLVRRKTRTRAKSSDGNNGEGDDERGG